MARYRKRNKQSILSAAVILLILGILLFVYSLGDLAQAPGIPSPSPSNTVSTSAPLPTDGQLSAVFIDVGQGDATLIISPTGETLLMDAGEYDSAAAVLDAIESAGATRLDHVIATHPHSDHIGGLREVLENIEWGTLYMPDATHTSQTFIRLLEYVDEQNREIEIVSAGDSIPLGGVTAEVLAPQYKEYENLNNYSITIKITHGETSLLLTADNEALSEREMIASGADLSCTLLTLPHHGSRTSSTADFLKATTPKYIIISLGADNLYGHPHEEVLKRLSDTDAEIFRTDLNGNIYAESDGKTLSVRPER
ncbi:MAG: ComEC/Rec2 family competence protein [Christensenellales bacterium]|jgi:competence protein ComEC